MSVTSTSIAELQFSLAWIASAAPAAAKTV
jgi:hypothetical protein